MKGLVTLRMPENFQVVVFVFRGGNVLAKTGFSAPVSKLTDENDPDKLSCLSCQEVIDRLLTQWFTSRLVLYLLKALLEKFQYS